MKSIFETENWKKETSSREKKSWPQPVKNSLASFRHQRGRNSTDPRPANACINSCANSALLNYIGRNYRTVLRLPLLDWCWEDKGPRTKKGWTSQHREKRMGAVGGGGGGDEGWGEGSCRHCCQSVYFLWHEIKLLQVLSIIESKHNRSLKLIIKGPVFCLWNTLVRRLEALSGKAELP